MKNIRERRRLQTSNVSSGTSRLRRYWNDSDLWTNLDGCSNAVMGFRVGERGTGATISIVRVAAWYPVIAPHQWRCLT